jgi:hypothetical protein
MNLADLRRRLSGRLGELSGDAVSAVDSPEVADPTASPDHAETTRSRPAEPREPPSTRREVLLAIIGDGDETEERRAWARAELLIPDAIAPSVLRATRPGPPAGRALPRG